MGNKVKAICVILVGVRVMLYCVSTIFVVIKICSFLFLSERIFIPTGLNFT